ncbi:MAG: hypothetical protein O2805_11960, partial [Proteobacteria bacterium]|nr:hypothetical protein [Pseudomonadota bacterium]
MLYWRQVLTLAIAGIAAVSAYGAPNEANLEQWIARDLTPYVTGQLTSQARFRNESIRFVVLSGENPQSAASELALNIRDRLRDAVSSEPGLRIVLQRDALSVAEAGKLDCIKDRVHYYIGVDVTEEQRGMVSVDIRALDIEDQSWVAGFTRTWRGRLDASQQSQLARQVADPSLRGERGAPYSESQFDMLAAHLAHELACSLLRQTSGEYVVAGLPDKPDAKADGEMLELVRNNLAEFRALQFATSDVDTNAVIEGKAHLIANELYQYWVTIRPKDSDPALPTLSANAYIRVSDKYASAALIPAVTVALARTSEQFVDNFSVVELRDSDACQAPAFQRRNSGMYDSRYSSSECFALQVDTTDDAILFFLNHQLNNGLVRLSDKNCADRTDARVAREGDTYRYPLPVDTLMSASWAATDGWQLAPDQDTYCPSSNKWDRCVVRLGECFSH